MGDGPGDCVKVATRLRPLSSKELASNEKSIIDLDINEELTGTGKVKIKDPESGNEDEFAFDLVFGIDVSQDTVFNCVGKPALEQAMTGYNGTIFAYGQTGSGKSWSMMGAQGDLRGIIPRVNEELFVRIAQETSSIATRRFLVMCSFFEIYNEIIFDLLNPCQDRSKLGAGLQVKEHPALGIYVKDLQEITVEDSDKLGKMMDSGTKNRAVSSTLMNSVSSRSHSIFTIKVHQKDEEDKSRNVFAKLNLVDLAGSERQKGTGASGQTLKEGANINKSLSALGNVINALVENANGKKIFVPFRNSKLTRVLQESLGGNSLCTMLAALSPAACNCDETVSTLRYANRAKAIKVSATKNEEASQISRLNAEIEELKKKLATGGGGGAGGNSLLAEEERNEMKAKFEAQLREMQEMVSSTWEEKSRISAQNEERLSRALEEHKRQAQQMQEECRKRINLLQEQRDLELSIRGLMDTVMSLPPMADAVPLAGLRSGTLPKSWLKQVVGISESAESFKQEQTMALVYHGAFNEDLRLLVEGEEAADQTTAHTGARRAQTKLEAFRRELSKLCTFRAQGQSKVHDFSASVTETHRAWASGGSDAIHAELKKSMGGETEEAQSELAVPPVYIQNLEDIGRILQLIEQQAKDKASEIQVLASFKIESTIELVNRASSLIPGVAPEGADRQLLEASAPKPGAADEAAAARASLPRDQRPLHEWTAQDVDDTIEGTEYVLQQIVPLGNLSKSKKKNPQELLGKPPPKYVHEVAYAIKQETGILPSMPEEWPDPREAKIDILQSIAEIASKTLNVGVEFNPENVLKGKEVPQTLRLLQLFSVTAAMHQHRACSKPEGTMDVSQAVPVLEAIARCIQRVFEVQAARRKPEDGQSSPTRELESNYRALQEQLAEEVQSRRRAEEKLAKAEEEMKVTSSLLTEGHNRLEIASKEAANVDTEKAALRQQVDVLRKGLLARAEEMKGNADITRMRDELQEAVVKFSKQSAHKIRITSEVKLLQQQQLETNTHNETMELELKRLKSRISEHIDGLSTDESEEIMVLHAENQKWDMRVAALEDKMREIVESDDAERHQETTLVEEKQLQSGKKDDSQMQLQVILDERDGLREGMDLLFQEKVRAGEEYDNLSNSYTMLTELLNERIEEASELEEQLQQYEYLHTMLLEQFGKRQNSPAKSAPTSEKSPKAAPPVDDKAGDDGDAVSNYSDDPDWR